MSLNSLSKGLVALLTTDAQAAAGPAAGAPSGAVGGGQPVAGAHSEGGGFREGGGAHSAGGGQSLAGAQSAAGGPSAVGEMGFVECLLRGFGGLASESAQGAAQLVKLLPIGDRPLPLFAHGVLLSSAIPFGFVRAARQVNPPPRTPPPRIPRP